MNVKVILVVDDEATNIDIIKNALEQDYKIKAATNGEKALTIAAKQPAPDLILLDIMMPGMDGYQVCRSLKSNPDTRNIPIVFVSAKITADEKQRGMEMGAIGYLSKPIDPTDLKETIQIVLRR